MLSEASSSNKRRSGIWNINVLDSLDILRYSGGPNTNIPEIKKGLIMNTKLAIVSVYRIGVVLLFLSILIIAVSKDVSPDKYAKISKCFNSAPENSKSGMSKDISRAESDFKITSFEYFILSSEYECLSK